MLRATGNKAIRTLLPLLVLVPIAEVGSADGPIRKAMAGSSEASEFNPRPVSGSETRGEIYQAIQDDLAQRGISGRGNLRPGDLRIQSSVPVLRHDMGLQVKRIGFDSIRRTTVFELWTPGEPQYLPFEVTAQRDPRDWGFRPPSEWDQGSTGAASQARNGVSRTRPTPPVLAKPGRLATLVMLGPNIRITTTVIPLQPGTKGQRIMVRDPATARVMAANVVDEGLLQTSF